MERTSKPGLYIHIPFCKSICSYCGFTKLFYNTNFSKIYLNKLKEELLKYKDYTFKSIYIGGGTPTSLSGDELSSLFLMIQEYMEEDSFITIETNPDLKEEKIKVLQDNHVKRVSIGVQTFNPKYQELINRHHSYQDIKNLIALLNKYDIDNINIDLIYGFNNQTIEELKDDLDLFTSLNIKHISTYCLQIEDGTMLHNKKYDEAEQELADDLYEYIVKYLKNKGIYRYEVSNFAYKGYESKHNLIYWNNQEYGGAGLSASSYIDGVRRTNTKNFTEYLKGNYQDYEEILNKEDQEFYFIMLGLRKEEGISLSLYKEIFNQEFKVKYNDKIKGLLDNKDILIDGDYLKVNPNKMFILDFILRKLLF